MKKDSLHPYLPSLLAGFSLLLAAVVQTGCEDDPTGVYFHGNTPSGHHDTGTVPAEGALTGNWKLFENGAGTNAAPWYFHFNDDGTWMTTDESSGQAPHVYGHYSTSGNSFSGDMTNPKVGNGEITGSWSGDTISLNFIEHWHTPSKVTQFTGNRY